MTATLTPAKADTIHELPKRSLIDDIIDENRIAQARYLPVMSPKMAVARRNSIQELVNLVLVEGEDYGVIPGTESKDPNKPSRKVLLKPGAEKICAYFGYVPSYEVLTGSIEDWAGQRFGEPLFYYHVNCILSRDSVAVGAGSGSCSTWERKYRYRSSKRACPSCGLQTLIKGNSKFERDEEYKRRGAWICYEKKGGCGAKHFGDDPDIMDQPLGDVPNPDFADIINTVRKMADKRAYIAATLSATGASQWFTQDIGDEDPPAETQPAAAPQAPAAKKTETQKPPPPEADAWRKGFIDKALKAYDTIGEAEFNGVLKAIGYDSMDKVTTYESALAVIQALRERTKVLKAQPVVVPPPPHADPTPFEASDEDLPPALTPSQAAPAPDDQVALAAIRSKITEYKTRLGVTRYGEILAGFRLNSPFGIADVYQGGDVLAAMKAELEVRMK